MQRASVVDGEIIVRQEDAPVPGNEQALIRITAAGVCHSDLHLAKGDWTGVGTTMPLGHEAIGVVEELGTGADQFVSVGDRVILGLGGSGGGYWCGACEYCLSGSPRLCSQSSGIMGVFAEQFCVWAKSLVVLPDTVPDSEAPLACGGLTAYAAVKKLVKHRVQPGRPVVIIGAAGGLGHYAVQIAKAWGYKVIGVDIGAERLEFVRSLGADLAVDASEAKEVIAKETGRGADACLVFSAALAGYDLGLELLRPAGLFVGVGIPANSEGKFGIDVFRFFRMEPTIIFSAVGTVQDMRELVDMAAAGQVSSHIGRTGPLSELESIFGELEAGAYVGRAVIDDLAN